MSLATRHDALPIVNTNSIIVFLLLSMGLSSVAIQLLDEQRGYTPILLLMLIQIAPVLFSITTGRVHFIALVMFNQFVSYSLAKLNQLFNIYKVSAVYPEALHAIEQLTICALLMMGSYYLFRLLFIKNNGTGKYAQINLELRHLHVVGMFCFAHTYITGLLPRTLTTALLVAYFVFLVVLYASTCTQSPKLLLIYRLAAVASATDSFLRSGMLSMLGSVGGIIFIVLFLHRKRLNLLMIPIMVLTLSIIQPVKGHYRRLLRHSGDLSLVAKVQALGSLVAWQYWDADIDPETIERAGLDVPDESVIDSEDIEEAKGDVLARGFARIGDDSLERVLAWTPKRVPFWGGESYENILYIFIPRFLWPGKPEWSFWNKFGRTYGFLSTDDYQTSVGIGYLGESYMNFGYLGMYTCALLMGFMIVLAEKLAFVYLGGNYMIPFVCFVSTVGMTHRSLGAIVNSIFLMFVMLMICRPVLVRLKKPEYA